MEELEEKVYGKSKEELKIAMKEALEKSDKSYTDFEKSQQEVLGIYKSDDINKMLIEYYDKKIGNSNNIQEELNKTFIEGAMEKLQEREQERALEELELPEDTDENTKKEALKKLKEDGKDKELTKEELQSELYKSIYESVFEEYSRRMLEVKDRQIKTGSLTVGDKEGTELVIYERYLVGIEMANHKLGGERFSADNRISDIRNEFKEKFDDKQNQVDYVTRDSIDKMKELYDKKKDISEEIEYYNLNPHLATPEQMKTLREQYMEVAFELRAMSPSLEEYSRQIDLLEENRRFADREGVEDNSSTDRDIAGMSVDSIGRPSIASQEVEDIKSSTMADTKDNIEDVRKLEESVDDDKEYRKREFIERYKEAKRDGDINKINMLILQYRDDVDVDNIIESENRENPERGNEDFEYNNYIGGLDAINSDDEMIDEMNKREDKEREERDSLEIKDEGISRSRF